MAYSPYFNPQFNGFNGFNYPAQMPQTAAQTPTLPPQQILQANGKASIDALRLSPNSSVLVMDTTAPIIWLCTSDGIGTVTAKAYDIVEHKTEPSVDMKTIEERLASVEHKIEEVLKHDEPDARSIEPKQTVEPVRQTYAAP